MNVYHRDCTFPTIATTIQISVRRIVYLAENMKWGMKNGCKPHIRSRQRVTAVSAAIITAKNDFKICEFACYKLTERMNELELN